MTSNLREAILALGDYAVGENADTKNPLRLTLTERLAANVQRIRMLGSVALDLAWIADGKLDASIMFPNNPWDTAAGVLLAREAGATIIDADGTDHTYTSTATVAVSQAPPRI
jgi:myo-inositol-1(or 4)-monophosphatase